MKKKNNSFSDLSLVDLQSKKVQFVKDLLTSRLTMDTTSLSSAANLQNLLRDLKAVNRLIAQKQATQTQKEVG